MPSVLSIHVGRPRTVSWRGRTVTTGIFKQPVDGPVMLEPHNLAGDGQADLRVHGGATKAVYAYAAEHYAYWRHTLGRLDLPFGSFGENLTVSALDERTISIGDRFRVGGAMVVVTEPRIPCAKLAIRLDREDIVQRFRDSQRCGMYLGVVESGPMQVGDALVPVHVRTHGLRVAEVFALATSQTDDRALLTRARDDVHLPTRWRERFGARLERS